MSHSLRLEQVPSKDDLDKIEEELEERRTGDEEVRDSYTVPELLEYGVEKQKHNRKSVTEYNDFWLSDRFLQFNFTAASGAAAAFVGGDFDTVYSAGLLAGAIAEYAIRKNHQRLENPYDEDKEKAFQEYTDES